MEINKTLILFALVITSVFAAGCGFKTTKTTTEHHEFGSYTLISTEVYEECMANNDIQGAKDVLDMKIYLGAFCCNGVSYDDVKNKNYNNIQYDIGNLQIAVAAYNEYNDESAMDVEVDWICNFTSCTQEQHNAIDGYVEWFHSAQNGNAEGTIKSYRKLVSKNYNEIIKIFGISGPGYDDLTPAQFKEVQKYMADPNYQVDISVWE